MSDRMDAFGIGLMELVDPVATLLELAGIASILVAAIYATGRFALDLRGGKERAYNDYRANLGRGILLGLEFLVGADIIATVTAPLTWESVGLLAIIVLIRTLLSFTLETEIEGRWPWKRGAARHGEQGEKKNGSGEEA